MRLRHLLVTVAATLSATGPAAATVPDPVADCCFVPTGPLSAPVPAGDVRFPEGQLVARRAADGAVFTAGWIPGPVLSTPVASGTWPYRAWWAGDVDSDQAIDLLGRDGTDIMLSLGREGGGWAPPRRWATLPRRFSVVRVGDLWAADLGPASDDLVALDPRTGELRWVLTDDDGRSVTSQRMGRWPRHTTLQLAQLDLGTQVDAIGVDERTGRLRIAWEADASRGLAADDPSWRIPPHASFAVADLNDDGFGDLVYRPHGSDDVYVRRAYESPPQSVVTAKVVHFRFHSARRWGTWDRRLPLTTTGAFGPRGGLIARDPRTGRIVGARSTARRFR
jgi:hypothetical protein